jgi:hypothetical protein
MKLIQLAAFFALASTSLAQTPPDKPVPKVLLCDENAGCGHQFIEGHKFKILTSDGLTVTVALAIMDNYTLADVSVTNAGATPIDVLPTGFHLEEVSPKPKALPSVDAASVMKSAQRRVAWGNALTAMGGSMARQQTTTNTNDNGTVNVSSSDGTTATGTYNDTGTSTSSTPDYAAQARANEVIRQRNAALAAMAGKLSSDVFEANTVLPNQTVRGIVLFEKDKKTQSLLLSLPIGGTVYQFPFMFTHQ